MTDRLEIEMRYQQQSTPKIETRLDNKGANFFKNEGGNDDDVQDPSEMNIVLNDDKIKVTASTKGKLNSSDKMKRSLERVHRRMSVAGSTPRSREVDLQDQVKFTTEGSDS